MRKLILIASVLISLGSCIKESDCGYCIYTVVDENGSTNSYDEICGKDYVKVQRDIKKNPKKDYKLTKYAYCRDITK